MLPHNPSTRAPESPHETATDHRPDDTPETAAETTSSASGSPHIESPHAQDATPEPPEQSAPQAAPHPVASAPPVPSRAEGPLRRRLRLNPTLGRERAKPIPTLGPDAALGEAAAPPQSAPRRLPAREAGEVMPIADRATDAPSSPAAAGPAATSSPQPITAPPGEPQAAGPKPVEPQPAPRVPPQRVAVPRDAEIDAELEAAIAAAQSLAAQQQPPVVVAAQQAQSDEDETAAHAIPLTEDALEPGLKLNGKVQSITGDDVFLDLGFRSPGIVSLRQFEPARKPLPGQMFEVVVDRVDSEEGLIQVSLPKGVRRRIGGWETIAKGQIVECLVSRTNKGGLEIAVGSLRGFLPASQVDLHYVGDLEPYVGQKLRVQVTEANPRKRNLVVSRRAVLIDERKEAEQSLWQTIDVGQTYDGTVKTLKDYGAFIDIGGVDGFVHVGDISWSHIRRPGDLLHVGQQVQVKVATLDREKKRIGLSIRQLQSNPWDSVESKYPQGARVHGTVTRTTEFGAFIELEPGVEGLAHISELDHQRVRKVTDVLKTGQEVDVQVREVDPAKQRISLSLKALAARPEEAAPAEEPAPEPHVRQRKGPLKGGTGAPAQTGGGLFGNPRDFH